MWQMAGLLMPLGDVLEVGGGRFVLAWGGEGLIEVPDWLLAVGVAIVIGEFS